METIFYYVKTGKILSKDEVSALMSGYAAPTGTIGIVNKSQRVQITDGVIQNVSDIKETSSIMSQDSVLDVFTEIVNKHNQDVKRGISPKSEIRKDELDRMIREVSDRIERQKNNQKDINLLINTAVQTILLNKGDTKQVLEKVAKEWKRLQ